jgi:hypothetical protein
MSADDEERPRHYRQAVGEAIAVPREVSRQQHDCAGDERQQGAPFPMHPEAPRDQRKGAGAEGRRQEQRFDLWAGRDDADDGQESHDQWSGQAVNGARPCHTHADPVGATDAVHAGHT